MDFHIEIQNLQIAQNKAELEQTAFRERLDKIELEQTVFRERLDKIELEEFAFRKQIHELEKSYKNSG